MVLSNDNVKTFLMITMDKVYLIEFLFYLMLCDQVSKCVKRIISKVFEIISRLVSISLLILTNILLLMQTKYRFHVVAILMLAVATMISIGSMNANAQNATQTAGQTTNMTNITEPFVSEHCKSWSSDRRQSILGPNTWTYNSL